MGMATLELSESDDEPAWLQEQASARKEQTSQALTADSSSEDSPAAAAAAAATSEDEAVHSGKGTGATAVAKAHGRAPPSHRLPLVIAPRVRRDMMLLETSRGEEIDFSGDFGCIGKMHVRQPPKPSTAGSSSEPAEGSLGVGAMRKTLMLDLKGKVYDADILPCNTVALVQVDGTKAKVEAIFSDFVQLAPPRDSIFDVQEVQGGDLGAGFFADGDGRDYDSDSEESEVGPLKEKRGGKMPAKGKRASAKKRKAPAKKSPTPQDKKSKR